MVSWSASAISDSGWPRKCWAANLRGAKRGAKVVGYVGMRYNLLLSLRSSRPSFLVNSHLMLLWSGIKFPFSSNLVVLTLTWQMPLTVSLTPWLVSTSWEVTSRVMRFNPILRHCWIRHQTQKDSPTRKEDPPQPDTTLHSLGEAGNGKGWGLEHACY